MTVSTTISKNGPYACTGSLVNFAFTFEISEETDLKVIHTDAAGLETVLTLTTDYTVSSAPWTSGGTITTVATYASGETITVKRETPLTQLLDLITGGSFPADSVEQALDKLTWLVQELQEAVDRAMQLPESAASSDLSFPEPAALQYLQWKSDLSGLQNVLEINPDTVSMSAYMQTLMPTASLSALQTALGMSTYFKTLLAAADSGAFIGLIEEARQNLLINGGLDFWQEQTSLATPSAGSAHYLADQMFIRSAGAALTSAGRSTTVRTGAKAKYSLELVGAASVTTVDAGHVVEAADTAELGTVTYSAWVYNGSGADFDPIIKLDTFDVEDVGTAVTNRVSQSAQTCTDGAWTRVSHSFDASALTDIEKGFVVYLQIPSGSMVAGDTNRIMECKLEHGSAATAFRRAGRNVQGERAMCQRYYEKSYNDDLDPGDTSGVDGLAVSRIEVTASASTYTGINDLRSNFNVAKRAVPSVTWYSPVTGAPDNIRNVAGAGSDVAVLTNQYVGENSTGYPTLTSSVDVNDLLVAHWVADARIAL